MIDLKGSFGLNYSPFIIIDEFRNVTENVPDCDPTAELAAFVVLSLDFPHQTGI